MSYTSDQYKYLLMKRLQRHFSMGTANRRAYVQSFFGKLFDVSVTVTEAAYDSFCSLMDEELEYCAKNGYYDCTQIPTSAIEAHSLLLVNAFAEIGVTLVVDTESNSNYYQGIFTKPDGEVLTFRVGKTNGYNHFKINAATNNEYQYAKLSAPYYQMQDMKVIGLNEINVRSAGPGTYWSYDADSASVTITGDGAYAGATKEEQLGSGTYTTVILGANVSRLLPSSLNDSDITTVVLLHSADAPLILDSGFCGTIFTSHTWDVYTDNEIFRNYNWGPRMNITWRTLTEWEG